MPENNVLVIGGGPAGLEAARGVADLGYPVKLVEKADRLGGMPILADYAALTPNMVNAEEAMGEMVQRIENDELIDIRNQLLSMPADSPPTRELTRRLAILNKKAQELAFEEFRASRVYETAVEEEAEAQRQAALDANATANAQTDSSARPIHEVAGIQLFPFSIATDTNNGIRALSGTVTNARTNAIDELTLEFDVFDSGDQMLGTTSDFIATLPGGSNWNFKAILLDTNIVRAVFKEFRDANGAIQANGPSALPPLPGGTPTPAPVPMPAP